MDGYSSGFAGRSAVITGGASGIGFATATEFARRGARLVLADVDKPALEQAVARLQAEGFDAHGVMCDVRYLEEMVHLADEAFRLLGRVDIVFSNAGIVVAGPIAQMTHEDWRWVIDIETCGARSMPPRRSCRGCSSRARAATSPSPRRSPDSYPMPASGRTALPNMALSASR